MHELTLANNLIELAGSYAADHGGQRVTRVNIRLGELCGIARALYFCFGPAARNTLCEGAVLHVTEVPLAVYCEGCRSAKRPHSPFNLRCPDCGRRAHKVLSGREMELVSIVLDDSAEPDGRAAHDRQREGATQ